MPRRHTHRPVPALLPLLLLGVMLLGVPAARADLTTTPTLWSNFGVWYPFTINGLPMRDFESPGSCTDPTKGPANFSAEVDISSGGDSGNYNIANCNPAPPGGDCCGPETSGFWAYFNGGGPTDTDVSDDYYAVRMRVNDDPRDSSDECLSNSHWNFLLDDDFDGFKEIWVDLWGNQDQIRILYEDNNSQFVSNDDPVPPSTNTFINQFTACAVDTMGVTCGTGGNVRACENSHSRVCGTSSLATDTSDCDQTTDATGEWYVDIQVPIAALTMSDGAFGSGGGATPLFTTFPPYVAWFLSTSDSSTDPVQKDFVSDCTVPSGPCSFTSPTAVTLSYFRAERLGGGVAFEWSTASESGNVGFDLFVETKGGWERITRRPVDSRNPFSLERLDYRLELPGVRGERFRIEDVDLFGKRRSHGPFEIERSYGARRPVERIDWTAVRAEHTAKAFQRASSRRAAASARARPHGAPVASGASADLLVDRDGVYRVTHAELLAGGVDLSGATASDVALILDDRPVPIRVGGPAKFGSGSFVEFLGTAAGSVYTRTNVYRLSVDPANALRMLPSHGAAGLPGSTGAETVYEETGVVDDDLTWSFSAPDPSDPWYQDWVVVHTGSPVSRDYAFTIDRLAAGGGDAALLLELWGMTDWPSGPDHHVLVALNGTPVADRRFDGLTSLELEVPVSAGLLVEGQNTITLSFPADADAGVAFEVAAVDRFGVRYPRTLYARDGELAFEGAATSYLVDGFSAGPVLAYQRQGESVRFLGNARVTPSASGFRAAFRAAEAKTESGLFVVQGDAIRSPSVRATREAPWLREGKADYLVIAHPDFLAGLEPLLEARRADGLRVRVADVEDVYGEFGHGRFGPEAIREYIRFAAAHLGTRMVLLVGADTYDYLDRTGVGSISFVPTLYDRTGPITRVAPVDSLYGDLDGDGVPEVAIGRFPVRTSDDLAAMVGKTLAYPQAGHFGRSVFTADESDTSNDFRSTSEETLAELGPDWEIARAYMDDLGLDGARAALLGELDQGVAFAQFAGHSGPEAWTYSGLLTRADAAALTNAGQPAVVSQLGCWNAFYVTPSASTLADALLTSGDRGAAAVLGPTTLSATTSNLFMGRYLNREIFQNGLALGPAMVAAKQEIAATRPWMIDVLRGFTLLGDPALKPAP